MNEKKIKLLFFSKPGLLTRGDFSKQVQPIQAIILRIFRYAKIAIELL